MEDAGTDLTRFVSEWGTEPLESPACSLCSGADRRQLLVERFAGYEFGLVECRECGFVYTCPRLTEGLHEALHTPHLRNALADAGVLATRHRVPVDRPAIFDYEGQDVHLERYEIGLRLLKQRVPSGRLLDVGCAGGRFVELAQQAGYEAIGCDLTEGAVAYGCDLGLDLRRGDVGSLDIPAGSLDVVTMWNVLEHVPDPKLTMGEVVSLLRPGGIALIESPNFGITRISARLGLTGPPDEYRLIAYEHINHFTPGTLRCLLRSVGCDCIEFSVATISGDPSRKVAIRNTITRLVFALTFRRVNLHFPLLALARRAGD